MLSVRDLSFAYDETPILEGVSMTVAPGEFVLLTGPNGAGKTSLVRHFNGLLEPDAGSVQIDGASVAENPVLARRAVGMVFQDPGDQFVESRVGADVAFGPENLGLARDNIESRVEAALSTVGMADCSDERITALSGGERTRVALAGVLAMDPDYVVLDEPFGSLDVEARRAVMDHLVGLVEAGTGVVVVTHDLRDAWGHADRVVALDDGQIAVEGAPAERLDQLADLAVVPRC
jgi:biotin transport system ATP-binding protein